MHPMTAPLAQHQAEIERNRRSWQSKPLLQSIYAGFYERILTLVQPELPGAIVEIGSGIGNLKSFLPRAITTDLFPNPWLVLVCDGYELPFLRGSVSHLLLFDVFHHLQAPNCFLKEARRVLAEKGRLILFEPYISWASLPVYGLLHHEPIGWRQPIEMAGTLSRPRHYYAAQGNATRLFFGKAQPAGLEGWSVFHATALASFSYLLSGGFSKPAFYPESWLPKFQRLDARLSRWPRLFGARCLVGLQPA